MDALALAKNSWERFTKIMPIPKPYHVVHSKWDLVGYSGGSPGLENAAKRWGRPIVPICFPVYFDASP